jgi:hypothetical protein
VTRQEAILPVAWHGKHSQFQRVAGTQAALPEDRDMSFALQRIFGEDDALSAGPTPSLLRRNRGVDIHSAAIRGHNTTILLPKEPFACLLNCNKRSTNCRKA